MAVEEIRQTLDPHFAGNKIPLALIDSSTIDRGETYANSNPFTKYLLENAIIAASVVVVISQ